MPVLPSTASFRLIACLRMQPLRRQSLGGVRPSPGAETSEGPPAWNDSGIADSPTSLRPRTGALRHLIFKHALSRNDAVGNRELRSAVPVGQRFQPVHEFTNANTKRFGQTNVHFPVPTALQGGTGRMPVLPSSASFRLSRNDAVERGRAQPPRLWFGAPSRRTRTLRHAPNHLLAARSKRAARAQPAAPGAGALPIPTASFRFTGLEVPGNRCGLRCVLMAMLRLVGSGQPTIHCQSEADRG